MTKKNLLKKAFIAYALCEFCVEVGALVYLKKHEVTKVHGVTVYKVPDWISNNVFHCRFACSTYFWFKPVILIDDSFYKLCDNDECIADFIIAHELAHIKLGHLKENIKTLLHGKLPKRNIRHEIEADKYAYTKFPNVLPEDAKKFFDKAGFAIEQERIDSVDTDIAYKNLTKEMW